MSRARAREDSAGRQARGLHKLRKGRDRCTARRRDGQPCQAPAIEGGLVCRVHGGAAPQVQIAAKYFLLQMAAYTTAAEFEAARGTSREFDALCRWSAADRELREYEFKLMLLAGLKAEVKQLKAEAEAVPKVSAT